MEKAVNGSTPVPDSQKSVDRVPESPPTLSQDEDENIEDYSQESEKFGEKEEAPAEAGCSHMYSSHSKGTDVVIDMEYESDEETGANCDPDPANTGMIVDDAEFSDGEDAMLVAAVENAEEGVKPMCQEEGEGAPVVEALPDTADAPKSLSEITLDPQIKAADDARRKDVERLRKFQPLDKIYPDVRISEHNTVAFFMAPNYSPGDPLEPHPPKMVPKWETKFVPMPFCEENIIIIRNAKTPGESDRHGHGRDQQSSEGVHKSSAKRICLWDRITETLGNYPIESVDDFGASIRRYCKIAGELKAFGYCVENIMSIPEKNNFFNKVVPFMLSLVLETSDIITCPIPFLRKNVNHNISLSQRQVACLLANAFFCTFPRRFKSEIEMPSINFKDLFHEEDERVMKVKAEKIRCLLNYFMRVEAELPSGVVTYSRKNLRHSMMPDWKNVDKNLTKLIPLIQGTIEDDGDGLLKVDFANSYIGGGALGRGAVQEEILFMIYPELILARLFCEKLNSNEAIIVTGCERFSSYKGYAYNFKYDGDYCDSTPIDSKGRRCTQIVAIDALYISRPTFQYHPKHILREVNKAYVGFSSPVTQPVAVATGKWGCGAFNGDPHLKTIIQLLAASHAGRDVAFFTFGDVECLNDVTSIYDSIAHMKIKDVWNLLAQYHSICCASGKPSRSLKEFCRQYADGQLSQAELKAQKAGSTSKKMKEVPLTNFYSVEKRQSVPLDDESVAALINGIDQINSPTKKLTSENAYPAGKRQREDELNEGQIQEILKEEETVPNEKIADETKQDVRSQPGNGDEENAASPKSSKRPKRTLLDFYRDSTE